ncbi:hypothetical protein HHL17_16730 [Chitinophaga sp. G-6-1-13]|uniref:Uncharacterized protein n=1 Tax=Chitinophaga fulva TaxID=2728842 RepID=A0A848GKA5_9BACT|nr:hypothetical protein [Chitinophaga fulva]NML38854.1 hypothetical protein [Chitinophaga fulva]
MKRIKIAFAALTAVVGIGGAYASTHQESTNNRAGTIYRWRTVVPNGPVLITTTIPNAKVFGGCTDGSNFCLRGTNVTPTSVPIVTLHKL